MKSILNFKVLLFLFIGYAESFAQQGILDTQFFDEGTLLMFENAGEFPSTAIDDFIQDSDGNFIVFGRSTASPTNNSLFMAKFTRNGAYVESFGNNGVRFFPEDGPLFGISAIRQLSNGNFVVLTGEVIGGPGNNSTVLRILEMDDNGNLVEGFGNGNNSYTIPGNVFYERLDVSPQGKIWVHFNKINEPNIFTISANIYCLQFNSDGSLNSQFGENGLFEFGEDEADERAFSIEFDENDNAYLCGGFKESTSFGIFAEALVVKVLNTGSLDNSFGTNGVFRFNDGNANFGAKDAKISNNHLFLCGFRYSPSESIQNAMILKIGISGSLNTSFGNSGFVLLNESISESKSMAISSQGQIAVLSELENSSTSEKDILVVLYDGNGNLQESFGVGGSSTPWDLNNGDDYGVKVLFDNNGNGIFTSGGGYSDNNSGGGGGSRALENGDYAFVQKYIYENPSSVSINVKNNLLIYPNPTIEEITVKADKLIDEYIFSDISGKVFMKNEVNKATEIQVSMDELNNGIYYLELIFSDHSREFHKVIKSNH